MSAVVLRAALGLRTAKVPAARIRRALASLANELAGESSLSGLRIFADGRNVAVRDDRRAWQPETGQVLLDFKVDDLAAKVAQLAEAPSAVRARSARAQLEFERGLDLEKSDQEAAKRAYGRAAELDPDLVDAYINLGRLSHEAGDLAEAVRVYRLALEREPEEPLLHFNLAVALEDLQGVAPAISHYERALQLDPFFADAHFNLAGLFEQLGRTADALRHYHAYKKLTEG